MIYKQTYTMYFMDWSFIMPLFLLLTGLKTPTNLVTLALVSELSCRIVPFCHRWFFPLEIFGTLKGYKTKSKKFFTNKSYGFA